MKKKMYQPFVYKSMSHILSKEQIEIIENFIGTNEPQILCCSPKDNKLKFRLYKKILNEPIGSFYIYGGSNYRTNGFYKSSDGNIYEIERYFSDLVYYCNTNY